MLHEEHGHDEDAGRVVVLEKGNRSLPWSDEEEWESGESGPGKSAEAARGAGCPMGGKYRK